MMYRFQVQVTAVMLTGLMRHLPTAEILGNVMSTTWAMSLFRHRFWSCRPGAMRDLGEAIERVETRHQRTRACAVRVLCSGSSERVVNVPVATCFVETFITTQSRSHPLVHMSRVERFFICLLDGALYENNWRGHRAAQVHSVRLIFFWEASGPVERRMALS